MGDSRVAVIGAGPAGLAAAWRLAESGVGVRVYEARERAGGRLRTEAVAGSEADAVVQLLSDGYDRTLALLGAMGLGDRVVAAPGRDALWRGGRPHVLRYGSVVSMAASGALPTGLKLRLGLHYVPFLDRRAGVLDLNHPAEAVPAGLDRESIAAWGRRELGEDFVELMAYPLLASYYGVTPEETSAAFFHGLARAGLHVSVLGVRGGVGGLAEAMAAALEARGVEVRCGTPVKALSRVMEGVALEVDGGLELHDGVVVAVPAPAAAGLVPELDLPGQVRTRSTATLVLAVDGAVDPGWFGLSVPRRESPGEVIAAVCVQPSKGTGLAGSGVVVVPAPGVGEAWSTAELGAVVSEALPALDVVLPGVAGRVVDGRLVRLPDQVVVPGPGHFTRLREPDAGRRPPGVELAGDYLVAPTVEGAVRSGLAAARRLTRAGA